MYFLSSGVKGLSEKPGLFVWFSVFLCKRFGRESVSYSVNKLTEKFRLIHNQANRALRNRALDMGLKFLRCHWFCS